LVIKHWLRTMQPAAPVPLVVVLAAILQEPAFFHTLGIDLAGTALTVTTDMAVLAVGVSVLATPLEYGKAYVCLAARMAALCLAALVAWAWCTAVACPCQLLAGRGRITFDPDGFWRVLSLVAVVATPATLSRQAGSVAAGAVLIAAFVAQLCLLSTCGGDQATILSKLAATILLAVGAGLISSGVLRICERD
jgi:hypothetical protein